MSKVITVECSSPVTKVFNFNEINDSEHYFDTTVGFLGPENIGLAYLFKFLS